MFELIRTKGLLGSDSNSSMLVEKLAEIGVDEKEVNIRNKLARGKFSASFMAQCLIAIGAISIRLDDV